MNEVFYNVRLRLDRNRLIEAYHDSQNIPIDQGDGKDLIKILRNELSSWLDVMGVEIEEIKEVSQ